MLARLNQKDEEESNSSLKARIDHSGEIVPVKGKGLDLNDLPDGAVHENQPLEITQVLLNQGAKRRAPE